MILESSPNNIYFFLQGTVVNPAKRQSREVICWFSAWLTLVAWLSVILYSHPVFPKRDFTTTHCILPHNDVCDHIIFPRNSTPWKSPYVLTSACHSKANQVHKNHHKCAILEFFFGLPWQNTILCLTILIKWIMSWQYTVYDTNFFRYWAVG